MTIEGGSVGIGGAAPSLFFGAAPVVDTLGGVSGSALDIGPAIGPVGLPVNEGPVSSWEGLAPMGQNNINTLDLAGGTNQPGFSLGGEIIFQPPVNSLNEADAIAEAESILTSVRTEPQPELSSFATDSEVVEPKIIKEAAYWFTDVPKVEQVVKPAEVIMAVPQLEPAVMPFGIPNSEEYPIPQVVTYPSWEPAVSTQNKTGVGSLAEIAPATAPRPVLQEDREEVEKAVENKELRKGEEVLQEEDAERKLYLEDQEASAVRRHEIREAVTRARIEADRLGLKRIAGWLVAKFLPSEHEGNRSQVVKKTGPDGSYQETVEEIAGVGEFASEQQAIKRSDQIVAAKKPVKLGKEGTPVAGQDVARVYKYRIIKPAQAYTEVVKRAVKKRLVPQVIETPHAVATPGWTATAGTPVKAGPALADFPALEGVFPKAD